MSQSFSPKNFPDLPTNDRLEQVVAILRQPIALAAFASFGVHGLLWAALPLLPKPVPQIEGRRSVGVVELTAAERLRLPQGDALPNVPLTSPYKLPNPAAGRSPFIPDSSSFYNSPRNPSNDPAGSPNTGEFQEPSNRRTPRTEIPIDPGQPNPPDSVPSETELRRQAIDDFYRNNPQPDSTPDSSPSTQTSPSTDPPPNPNPQNSPNPGDSANPGQPNSPPSGNPNPATPGTTNPGNRISQGTIDEQTRRRNEIARLFGYNSENTSQESFQTNFAQFNGIANTKSKGNLKQDHDPIRVNDPPYPKAACPYKRKGIASVGALLDPEGKIVDDPILLKSSGYQALNDAALEYVKQQKLERDKKQRYRIEEWIFEFDYPSNACA